ncbi:DUF2235 domain-containing protein [Tranquillimonas alkanivorans]|uniref:Uncharacterized alpha/beta hydrolase domain n=1 Tax=Tranquillimonas alkanivorans TaxID=441119 RepID=A0A1I5MBQ6_9RHOB|nr:DUF2235 domain-containing protein [Tranquillimonas alkanivorans]SFP07058.1 Uncharacterized alpha/beta hydrolase domain [Tranquillimonas alkanivorans]
MNKVRRVEQTPRRKRRGPVDHIVILDGTMSELTPGRETNAGLTYRLLSEMAPCAGLSLRYEAGIQWRSWSATRDVIEGRGINRQIQRAYGALASRYRPGDRIFLFGYSRGAYAVRSLAGVIDRVGLVRPEHATVRTIEQAYRHYRYSPNSDTAEAFRRLHCHDDEVRIEVIGVWDTVKALGLRAPVVWRYTEPAHDFHGHDLTRVTRNGFHALATDETRDAYAPVLWTTPPDFDGRLEQMWFPGTHGDVGGQIEDVAAARPLANVSLRWMLGRAEECGLTLPHRWERRFPADPDAPSIGTMHGWGKCFIARHPRVIGADPSEVMHPAARRPARSRRPIRDRLFGPVEPELPGPPSAAS